MDRRVRAAASKVGLSLATAVLALVVSSCASDEPGGVAIPFAATADGSTALGVSVSSCNSSPPPTVEILAQGDSSVEVRAVADDSSSDDCLDSATVCLDAPLGGRTLIDDTTGEEVTVDVVSDPDFESSCPN